MCDRKGCTRKAVESFNFQEADYCFCKKCTDIVYELLECMTTGKPTEIYLEDVD
jgi:hypothetical protein